MLMLTLRFVTKLIHFVSIGVHFVSTLFVNLTDRFTVNL